MRLAIFSDVHANIEALSAVRQDCRGADVDRYFCLGDVVGYGGSPNECAQVVREWAEVTILGNHDAAVAGRMDYSYYYDAARQALDQHSSVLSSDNMEWLKGLPYKHRVDETGVDLCHGSPVRIEEFDYIFAPEQARDCFAIWNELNNLTLIGHSHLCKVFMLKGGGVEELPPTQVTLEADAKYIVSVGSVGQPRDYDNRASYVVFDTESRVLEFKRVEYDIEAAARRVFDNDIERNFGHRLFIGV